MIINLKREIFQKIKDNKFKLDINKIDSYLERPNAKALLELAVSNSMRCKASHTLDPKVFGEVDFDFGCRIGFPDVSLEIKKGNNKDVNIYAFAPRLYMEKDLVLSLGLTKEIYDEVDESQSSYEVDIDFEKL